jgi:aspartyl-tRNA synthetase
MTDELSAHVGESITIQGWLHKKRLLGGLNFITLRVGHLGGDVDGAEG